MKLLPILTKFDRLNRLLNRNNTNKLPQYTYKRAFIRCDWTPVILSNKKVLSCIMTVFLRRRIYNFKLRSINYFLILSSIFWHLYFFTSFCAVWKYKHTEHKAYCNRLLNNLHFLFEKQKCSGYSDENLYTAVCVCIELFLILFGTVYCCMHGSQ